MTCWVLSFDQVHFQINRNIQRKTNIFAKNFIEKWQQHFFESLQEKIKFRKQNKCQFRGNCSFHLKLVEKAYIV